MWSAHRELGTRPTGLWECWASTVPTPRYVADLISNTKRLGREPAARQRHHATIGTVRKIDAIGLEMFSSLSINHDARVGASQLNRVAIEERLLSRRLIPVVFIYGNALRPLQVARRLLFTSQRAIGVRWYLCRSALHDISKQTFV